MRALALTGIGFVACFAAAAGLYGSGAGSDPAAISAYYADAGDRLRQILGFAVLLAGCALLLVYAVVLVRAVVPDGALATAAAASGAACAALLAVGNALWAASAITVELERGYRIAPATHLLLEDTGWAVIVGAAALAVPFAAIVSVAARRSPRFPRWFAWLGALAVAGLCAAWWYVPLAAFLAWVAAGSLLVARRA